jgi:hypothetical protein
MVFDFRIPCISHDIMGKKVKDRQRMRLSCSENIRVGGVVGNWVGGGAHKTKMSKT